MNKVETLGILAMAGAIGLMENDEESRQAVAQAGGAMLSAIESCQVEPEELEDFIAYARQGLMNVTKAIENAENLLTVEK